MKKLSVLSMTTLFLFSCQTLIYAGDLDIFKGKSGNLKIAGGTAHIPVMKAAAKMIIEGDR